MFLPAMGLELSHSSSLQHVVFRDAAVLGHVGVGGRRPIAGVHAQVVINAAAMLQNQIVRTY